MAVSKKVGIVACSYEGAALCYRDLCFRALVEHGTHPEIALHTAPWDHYVQALDRHDWGAVAELMLGSARKLATAGADFLICPDNTIHRALPLIRHLLPCPWLPIADVVALEAHQRGYRTVGILGTRWLAESEVYPDALARHQIQYVRPEMADRIEVSRIIMEELVYGESETTSIAMLQSVIHELRESGADSVVLGCTELPLVLDEETSELPILDSTRLLADAAVRFAFGAQAEFSFL